MSPVPIRYLWHEYSDNLDREGSHDEIECATNEGGIVVTVSGTQARTYPVNGSLACRAFTFYSSVHKVPVSVTISDEMCQLGAEKLSAEIGSALSQAPR